MKSKASEESALIESSARLIKQKHSRFNKDYLDQLVAQSNNINYLILINSNLKSRHKRIKLLKSTLKKIRHEINKQEEYKNLENESSANVVDASQIGMEVFVGTSTTSTTMLGFLKAIATNIYTIADIAVGGVAAGFAAIIANGQDFYLALKDWMNGKEGVQTKTRLAVGAFNVALNVAVGAVAIAALATAVVAAPYVIASAAIVTFAAVVYRDAYGAKQEHAKASETKIEIKKTMDALDKHMNDEHLAENNKKLEDLKSTLKDHQEKRMNYQTNRGFNMGYLTGSLLILGGIFFPPLAIAGVGVLAVTALAKLGNYYFDNKLSKGVIEAKKNIGNLASGKAVEEKSLDDTSIQHQKLESATINHKTSYSIMSERLGKGDFPNSVQESKMTNDPQAAEPKSTLLENDMKSKIKADENHQPPKPTHSFKR